jgi:branched-chain amino acid transport system substrate-binding protein
MKGFRERGLADAGIRVIATGDLTDDHVLPAMGDATLGVITSFHYSAAHDSKENKAFLKAFADANPGPDARISWPWPHTTAWPPSTMR